MEDEILDAQAGAGRQNNGRSPKKGNKNFLVPIMGVIIVLLALALLFMSTQLKEALKADETASGDLAEELAAGEKDPSRAESPAENELSEADQLPHSLSASTDLFTPTAIPFPLDLFTAGLVRVPDPLSGDNPRYPEQQTTMPPPGAQLCDPGLSTCFVRVTEGPVMRHEYSRFDPFNADKTMVILHHMDEGYFAIFRTAVPYDTPSNLVARLSLGEPRWHRTDPGIILGLDGFQLLQYDVRTGTTTTVKDFAGDPVIGPIIARETDLYRVTMKDEGECSWDGRWWALALQGSADDYRLRHLFTWDRATDSIQGLLQLRPDQNGIDWVGMSPKGSWVIIGSVPGNGAPLDGTVIANRELTLFHRIDYDVAHSDVGLDSQGNEVLVMQNTRTDYIDMLPIDTLTRPIMETGGSYTGTGRTPLLRLFYDWSSPLTFDSGVHISCNAPGWAVVSTHIALGTPERNWLDRSIVLVHLDENDPRVFYLAKIHNTTEDYWEETQATVTNDGQTVLWVANFNLDPGHNKTALMRLDVPR